MIVEYKGKKIDTTFGNYHLSDTEYNNLMEQFNAVPSDKDIENEIANLLCQDGKQMTNIESKFFRKLMYDTLVYTSKWTINECFEYRPLLDIFYSKVKDKPDFFNEATLLDNILKSMTLGGKGIAQKVANFPLDTIDKVLRKYNVNNNWYDMSCGWGARLTGALKNNVNYYGTDPNYKLVEQLNKYVDYWKEKTHTRPNVDIKCQGSEIYVAEWNNKMGLCFTSPPYFNLEDYRYGNQSYKNGTSYEMWLNNFLEPTIQNCYKYLIDNGYMAINVKNFNGYDLENDTIKLAEKNGFTYIEDFKLENIKRITEKKELLDNSERIMIFMKKGFENQRKNNEIIQTNIFDFISEV